MRRVNITVPDKIKDQADMLVKDGLYGSFSDMVRIGLRELLQSRENVKTLKRQIQDWKRADELEFWEQGDPQE